MVALGTVGVALSCMAAWLSHVIWIVSTLASDAGATAGQIILGVMGVLIPPVGVIHDFVLWFT